jgi:hypothetical protein
VTSSWSIVIQLICGDSTIFIITTKSKIIITKPKCRTYKEEEDVDKKVRYIFQSGVEKAIKQIKGRKAAEHADVPGDLLQVSDKIVSH